MRWGLSELASKPVVLVERFLSKFLLKPLLGIWNRRMWFEIAQSYWGQLMPHHPLWWNRCLWRWSGEYCLLRLLQGFWPSTVQYHCQVEWCVLKSRRIICWTAALEWSLVIPVWLEAGCNWCSLEIRIGSATVKHTGQIGENVPSAYLWMKPNWASGGCARGGCCL